MSTVRWDDLIRTVDSAQKPNGNGYLDSVNVAGLGLVNVSRSNGGDTGSMTGVSSIQLHDPSRGENGGGWILERAPDGTVTRTAYDYKTGLIDYLPAIGAAVVAGGGMAGLFDGITAGVAESAGVVEAAGWTSGYELPMGSDLLSMTGAESVVAAETLATDLYANETAKLIQQQTLAQSGVNLLPTTLPTIDLSAGILGAEFANETAKLLGQQAVAQAGGNLLSTTLPTLSTVGSAIGTGLTTGTGILGEVVRTVVGTGADIVRAVAPAVIGGAVTGGVRPGQTGGGLNPYPPGMNPNGMNPYMFGMGQDNNSTLLLVGGMMAFAVIVAVALRK